MAARSAISPLTVSGDVDGGSCSWSTMVASAGSAASPSVVAHSRSASARTKDRTNIGIDPGKDINWVTSGSIRPRQLFIDGKIDAFLGLPPEPQELRARHIGRVLLDSTVDRPYSHYFCSSLYSLAHFSGKPMRRRPSSTVLSRSTQYRGALVL